MYDWSQILFPIRVRLFNIFGILAFCLATAGLAWSSGCAANGYERAFRRSSAGLGISVLLYSFVIFGTFQNYYYWYLSPTFVFWVIVTGVAADVTLRVVQPRPFIQWSALVLLALVLFWHVGVSPRTIESPLFKARYATATWIDRNLEQDAIIGAFNAGQIGYFSNRRVVNLDGLVNHVTYFRRVIQAPTTEPMIDYLADMNIRYIVDYRFGRWASEIAERYDVIREFPIEGQDASVQVLKKSRPEPR